MNDEPEKLGSRIAIIAGFTTVAFFGLAAFEFLLGNYLAGFSDIGLAVAWAAFPVARRAWWRLGYQQGRREALASAYASMVAGDDIQTWGAKEAEAQLFAVMVADSTRLARRKRSR